MSELSDALFKDIGAEVEALSKQWLPRLEAWWFEPSDETVERMRAAVAGAVSEHWAQIEVKAPEPPPMMSWPEMLDLMRRAMPPKRVLLVAPERAEGVRAALAQRVANERDWSMVAELNAIEVRGDDDGVFVRDPDESWLMPGETVRFW